MWLLLDTAEPVLLKGTKNIPVKLFSFSLIQLSNDVRYGCFNFGNNNCQFEVITRTNLLPEEKNLLQVDGTTIYATSSLHVRNIPLWLSHNDKYYSTITENNILKVNAKQKHCANVNRSEMLDD